MAGKDFSHLKGKTRHDVAALVVSGDMTEADALAFGRQRGEKQIADAIEKARSNA